jgi:hypothetical protein
LSFPEDLDMDRVLREALAGIEVAVNEWLNGAPTSEEPLMNRLTAQFTRRRRRCDVGVRVPIAMTAKVAFLHRRGVRQTDAYGADLGITIEIPDRNYRKTVLFQIKVSEDFSARLERKQLDQALVDGRTRDRSFILVADKLRQRMRVKSVSDAIRLIRDGNETAEVDCAEWMTVSEWLTKWISCDIGPASKINDPHSVERLLQAFVVEIPDDWEWPWDGGNNTDYADGQIPAKAWLEIFFRQVADSRE